jgi:hypothetical protein
MAWGSVEKYLTVPSRRGLFLLATANGKYVSLLPHPFICSIQLILTQRMPFISRFQKRKQALAGVMRITPEGTLGTWFV